MNKRLAITAAAALAAAAGLLRVQHCGQQRRNRAACRARTRRPARQHSAAAGIERAGPVAEAVLRRADLVSGLVIVDGAIALGSYQSPRDLPYYLRNQTLREYISAATASNPLLTGRLLRSFIHVNEAARPETVAMLQEPMQRGGYTEALAAWNGFVGQFG